MQVLTCKSNLYVSVRVTHLHEAYRDIMQQDPFATYNPVPIFNLTDALPQIHFPTYFSTFTSSSFPERVILSYPPYVGALSNILNETLSEVVEGYLVVRAALSLSPYLGANTEAWKAQRTLLETLTGVKKGAIGDRSEYCLERVEDNLGFASGRYFVKEAFGGNSKNKATKVITGEFRRQLCSSALIGNEEAKLIVIRYRKGIQGVAEAY